MDIIYTILIIGAIWYVGKLLLQQAPTKRIEKYEEFAEVMFRSYQTTNKVSFGEEKDPPEVSRMRDWYIRLKEKYKHDQTKLVQLAEDWKDYAFNLSSKNINHYLWLEDEDKESSDERYGKTREAHMKIEEIENRFANMLDPQYYLDLVAERKKKQEEVEAFWESPEDRRYLKETPATEP